MKLGTVTKQPIEKFSYTVNYVDALTIGDNIQTATAVVDISGLTITNVGVYDTRVKFWVEDGTSGSTYKVTVTAYTADGRVFQDEIIFKIKEV
jgi:hypothetical protein